MKVTAIAVSLPQLRSRSCMELAAPPTYYVHPEFGYFCPSPGARRELRVAVVSMLLGMVIGAAVVTVGAGHAGESDGGSSSSCAMS